MKRTFVVDGIESVSQSQQTPSRAVLRDKLDGAALAPERELIPELHRGAFREAATSRGGIRLEWKEQGEKKIVKQEEEKLGPLFCLFARRRLSFFL